MCERIHVWGCVPHELSPSLHVHYTYNVGTTCSLPQTLTCVHVQHYTYSTCTHDSWGK